MTLITIVGVAVSGPFTSFGGAVKEWRRRRAEKQRFLESPFLLCRLNWERINGDLKRVI